MRNILIGLTARMPRAWKSLSMGLIATACLALTMGVAATPASAHGSPGYGTPFPNCSHYQNYTGYGIPAGTDIPPWGYHASQSFPDGGSGFSWGWGDINLDTNWISGRICEDTHAHGHRRVISIKVGPKITYHSHVAMMWGYPGNVIKTSLTITASNDPLCAVGTKGRIIMYASYNGVRSDSMNFIFGAGCQDQNHLYHGSQVDTQVPPL